MFVPSLNGIGQGQIDCHKTWYHVSLWGLNSKTGELIKKTQDFSNNMVFVSYPLLKEANISIKLICFDQSPDNSPKSQKQKHSC